MFSSVSLMSVLTVLFVVTGVYSVVRLAALASGVSVAIDRAVDRAAELSHVLMSVAMIAMTWGWSGGPSSPSGVLQIVAFSLVGLYFLVGAVRGYRAPATGAYHLVMALAMVWMVASMPLLMGAGSSSGAAMEDMPWMTSGGSTREGPVGVGAHQWVLPVSIVFVALLAAATLFWATRVARRAADQDGTCCAPGGGAGVGSGPASGTGDDTGNGSGGVAVAIAPPKPVASLLSPRADAVCHVLMSAGMAGMLAAML